MLYGGEEQSKSYGQMMIIGHVDDVETIRHLPSTIKVTVVEDTSDVPK